ncbi:bifunctional hydroxymethylpyrimidine kinase/phosphomethylpyrimidine kinase [Sphingoaurantiacus capsulatus]|uniref:hydroxymethylpyrimidine kinase n=1 Tax=Sphingoaurantiacus capsulatus TaxID=1771310 RepID=A0ABV7XB92_9SPHN
MIGRVLIVAGSDSGGGAGIQADIKAVTMLGGYAATAIAALTVQNTLGVTAVHPVPPAFVQAQMRAVLDDIGADAIKTGMLGDAAMVAAVSEVIEALAAPPALVVDPVMVAKGGARLLDADAVSAVTGRLLPLAALVTPNAPELEALTGLAVIDEASAVAAGRALQAQGARAVLVKGGHLPGDEVVDWLLAPDGDHRFAAPRIETRHTHGTGCTLASAIACGLAKGLSLKDSVAEARDYVRAAIAAAPGLGQGHGPLGHNFAVLK